MLGSEAIAREVPFLRRYARALSGNQAAGDAYVAATLETLLQQGWGSNSGDPRVALYNIFTKVWNTVPENRAPRPTARPAAGADRRIAALPSRPRQAFVLHALENFDEEQGAAILDVPREEFARLLETAGMELAQQLATDVLIIEDEPLIAMDLENIVQEYGHRVVGIARTHREAIAIARDDPPGLVLADVQLADGSSGLEAVSELIESVSVPVIFITAFPERLLTGERPEPTFLIAKPFQPSTVAAVIGQALFFEQKAGRPAEHAAL